MLRRLAPTGVRLLVLALVVGLIAWRLDWSQVHTMLHPASWAFLLLAIGANFVSVGFKGEAWKGIVDGLPSLDAPTRYRDVISPLFVGFLFNTVLAARLGELAKVLLLRRRLQARGQRVSATSLIGTIVAENLISTIVWVVLVVLIGLFLPLPFYAWVVSLVVGVVCVVVVTIAMATTTGHRLPSWVTHGSIGHRVMSALVRMWEAVQESHLALRNPRLLGVVGVACLGSWLGQWAGIHWTLLAFGIHSPGWGGAGLLLVTISVAQAFPLLPGNMVVFQAAAMLPLTTTYGVGSSRALVFAVVLQFTEAVVGVAVGFLFLLGEGVTFGQLRRQAQEEQVAQEAQAEAAER